MKDKGTGMECIRLALAAQTVHKNALVCAVKLANVCVINTNGEEVNIKRRYYMNVVRFFFYLEA